MFETTTIEVFVVPPLFYGSPWASDHWDLLNVHLSSCFFLLSHWATHLLASHQKKKWKKMLDKHFFETSNIHQDIPVWSSYLDLSWVPTRNGVLNWPLLSFITSTHLGAERFMMRVPRGREVHENLNLGQRGSWWHDAMVPEVFFQTKKMPCEPTIPGFSHNKGCKWKSAFFKFVKDCRIIGENLGKTPWDEPATRTQIIDPMVQGIPNRWTTKKTRPYFPLNLGCLIGILVFWKSPYN